jgi:hypothetical protein
MSLYNYWIVFIDKCLHDLHISKHTNLIHSVELFYSSSQDSMILKIKSAQMRKPAISALLFDILPTITFNSINGFHYNDINYINTMIHNKYTNSQFIYPLSQAFTTYECGVCLENYQQLYFFKNCIHGLCATCFANILSTKWKDSKCPFCRTSIIPQHINFFRRIVSDTFHNTIYYGIVVNIDYIIETEIDANAHIEYLVYFTDYDRCHYTLEQLQPKLLTEGQMKTLSPALITHLHRMCFNT